MQGFVPRNCRTFTDFEDAAADWMKSWGYLDAQRTPTGPDSGIDVQAKGAVAQVKATTSPVGRADIQRIRGVAHDGREAIFFSLGGYSAGAVEWAEDAGVALFQFAGYDGTIEAISTHATTLLKSNRLARRRSSEMELDHQALIRRARERERVNLERHREARTVASTPTSDRRRRWWWRRPSA